MSFLELDAQLHLLNAAEEHYEDIAVLVDMPADQKDGFLDTIVSRRLDVVVAALTDMGIEIPRRMENSGRSE